MPPCIRINGNPHRHREDGQKGYPQDQTFEIQSSLTPFFIIARYREDGLTFTYRIQASVKASQRIQSKRRLHVVVNVVIADPGLLPCGSLLP